VKRIAVVLGRGGHTAQTFALVDSLGEDYNFIYLMGLLDNLTPTKIRIPGTILRVFTPRLLPQDSRVMTVLRTILTLLISFMYLAFYRPNIIISCGTGMTVPIFYSARSLGIPTVFVESMSRVESLSKTGRLLLGRVSLFLVQWEQLAEKTPLAGYGGQLL
jgi:UDP-N-acetylglucosamine:LPS N-acetylglucosamine transferase